MDVKRQRTVSENQCCSCPCKQTQRSHAVLDPLKEGLKPYRRFEAFPKTACCGTIWLIWQWCRCNVVRDAMGLRGVRRTYYILLRLLITVTPPFLLTHILLYMTPLPVDTTRWSAAHYAVPTGNGCQPAWKEVLGALFIYFTTLSNRFASNTTVCPFNIEVIEKNFDKDCLSVEPGQACSVLSMSQATIERFRNNLFQLGDRNLVGFSTVFHSGPTRANFPSPSPLTLRLEDLNLAESSSSKVLIMRSYAWMSKAAADSCIEHYPVLTVVKSRLIHGSSKIVRIMNGSQVCLPHSRTTTLFQNPSMVIAYAVVPKAW